MSEHRKSPDPNVEKIRDLLLERSIFGLAKYGLTTADNPLSLKEWLRHAQEEALDFAVYCQAAIEDIEKDEAAAFSSGDKNTERDRAT